MSGWNDSLTGEYLWSSVNFGEAVTEVMTPLTWSVLQFTLDDWVFIPGMPTVGVIGGRPYLNISILATVFQTVGRSQQDLLNYMESTLYMRLPEDLSIPLIPLSALTRLRSVFSSLQAQQKQRRGIRRTPRYVDSNVAWFQGIRQAIEAESTGAGLSRLWHAEIKPHVKEGVWCVLGSVMDSAHYTLTQRRRLTTLVGPDDADILIGNLSHGDAPVESLGPLLGLDRVARGEMSRAAYLQAYGHRGPNEFELSVPRPSEDPAWLDEELERIGRRVVDVESLMARQREAFARAWRRLEARAPRAARRIGRRLDESGRRARLRELARSAYVRDRWAVRLFALRAGELTGLGNQVFYLTLGELLALLAGDRSQMQAIPGRVEAYRQYKALPPYPSVICAPFDPFAWAADPDRPTDIFPGTPATAKDLDLVVGSPGSAGVVEGIVRVIDHPRNADLFQQGEILVAVQTDIAWTLLFPRAAAVITDVGAPLSHAAIVARELGIPAVVGCGNATAVLQTGDRVRVDGGRGIVKIVQQAAAR
ncbi:MAG TPA: PEP-utilizing enzyme [Anaerolineae bacterium]|nr:PEP-utilizing enzyme [Anaerolineae bacterium]